MHGMVAPSSKPQIERAPRNKGGPGLHVLGRSKMAKTDAIENDFLSVIQDGRSGPLPSQFVVFLYFRVSICVWTEKRKVPDTKMKDPGMQGKDTSEYSSWDFRNSSA